MVALGFAVVVSTGTVVAETVVAGTIFRIFGFTLAIAVQHRIMYMYNPDMVQSAFHESQNYILTYQTVRFFDRWGY